LVKNQYTAMPTRTSILWLLFIGIAFVNLTGILLDLPWLEQISKPLIMIVLAWIFTRESNKKNIYFNAAIFAFIFSWLGDILLMFQSQSPLFFLIGLGAFFISQCGYIFTFSQSINPQLPAIFKQKPWTILPYLVYACSFYFLLFPRLDFILKIAVACYALALCGMGFMAFNRWGRCGKNSFYPVFFGSLLFLISDSLIGINAFYQSFHSAGFWVMATYMAAQGLIVRGLISN
jgi:uncharacterized membrane protein YhhN